MAIATFAERYWIYDGTWYGLLSSEEQRMILSFGVDTQDCGMAMPTTFTFNIC